MNSRHRATIRGSLTIIGLGIALAASPASALAQQGWSGYAAPPAATYTYAPQPYAWQGYAPGTAWTGPAYATSGPAVATVPAQPAAAPGPGWAGYNPAASWTGYAPAQAWTGYAPGPISVTPRSYQRPGRLLGWGWDGGGSYREPGTGRRTPMLKPWLPGAAGS